MPSKMTESEAIKEVRFNMSTIGLSDEASNRVVEARYMAINALEKQEKIKEIIANANQWSKEDVVVKAQAYCDIDKILRSDE